MEVRPTPPAETAANSGSKGRRAPATRNSSSQATPHRSYRTVILVVLALVVGFGSGALVSRRRNWLREHEVVVAVNGTTITKDQLFRRLELASGSNVVQQMVSEELQMQFAKQKKVAPSDADVEARFAELSKRPGFERGIAAKGQTRDEVKRGLRIRMSEAAVINQGVSVTDAEIRKFYERNIDKKNPQAQYYTPEVVQIAIILTSTEDAAKKANADLLKGIPFATVAKTHSQDSSRGIGGIMPPFPRGLGRSAKIPGLQEAIFAMKIGDTIGPRKFADAWLIIKCLDLRPATTLPFDAVKGECRTGAMLTKGLPAKAKKTQEEFVEFQKSAKIQAFWPQYKKAVTPE